MNDTQLLWAIKSIIDSKERIYHKDIELFSMMAIYGSVGTEVPRDPTSSIVSEIRKLLEKKGE